MKNDSDDLKKYLDGRDAFTGKEMEEILCELRQSYEIARIVDPDECRALSIREDGGIEYGEPCYSVWGTGARCSHCTSFRSCRINAELSRSERIGGRNYRVRSVPLALTAEDGTRFSCALELINPERNRSRRIEENENDLNFLMFHDILTGTLNRDGLQRAIRRALSDEPDRAYMLIMTDVSRFRLVNDLFGKQKGSDVLMAIGELLKNYGKGSQIVGRAGDDQFVLFVPADDFSPESLQELLLFAEHRLDRPYYHLCIHAAIYPVFKREHQLPVSVLFDRARLALDTVRDNQERRLVWFTDEMLDRELAGQKIVSGFRRALEGGEFSLQIEPRTDRTGRIAGGDASMRWIREDGAEIPAGQYLPVLEKTGLISELNRFTWETAVRLLSSESGAVSEEGSITVEVSPRTAYYLDAAGVLEALCTKYRVPVKQLHLYITGSDVAGYPDGCLRMIRELREKGFYTEISGAWVKEGSLWIRENGEADLIRVCPVPSGERGADSRSGMLLAGAVDLARRLGMEVLARDIQTEEQKKAMEELGCTCFQGSAVAAPTTAEAFIRMIGGEKN
jgi:EAL domain-containing protein (putative c-di-GMP-specific phosphodiesterase class I)/GGDEF domain-containing protein